MALVAIAAMCGLLAALAWQQGGYFPPSYLHAGAVAFALLAVLLLVRAPGFTLSREAWTALGALLALTVWTWLATGWSSMPTVGVQDAQRDLMYLAMFGVAVLAAGSGRTATFAVWCSLVVAMVIVVAGLGSRLDPSGTPLSLALDPTQYRLSYPLTYWNAYGALAGMAAVLACGLAADRATPIGLRALSAGMSVLAMVAMYLSLSRGAWLAVMVGVAVLIFVTPKRGAMLMSIATVGAASAVAILALTTPLVDNPAAGGGEASAGHSYIPKLILLALAAAAVQAVLARVERTVRQSPTLVVAGRRIQVLLAVGVVLGALGVLALAGTAVDGKFYKVDNFISTQWSDFMRPANGPGPGSSRLVTAKTTRGDVYRVALDDWKDHPLFGSGAGSFSASWYAHRRYNQPLQNAHSLYLETLAELGLLGIVILLAFIGSCVKAAVRARRKPTALSRGQATAVMASTSVWLVHAGVDWDWQMSALTGLALFLIGTLFPLGIRQGHADTSRRRRRQKTGLRAEARRVRRRIEALTGGVAGLARGFGVTGSRVAGSLCAAAAIYAWVSGAQAQRYVDANRLGASGQYAAALQKARSVTMSPASTAAIVVEAYALQDLGHRTAAAADFARAAAADPGDWSIRLNWASDLAQEHEWGPAYRQFTNALQLNPLLYAPQPLWRFCYFTQSLRCLLLAND